MCGGKHIVQNHIMGLEILRNDPQELSVVGDNMTPGVESYTKGMPCLGMEILCI